MIPFIVWSALIFLICIQNVTADQIIYQDMMLLFCYVWSLLTHLDYEPMIKSMQLHYIPFTTSSEKDLFLDPISLEWDSRRSAMTNPKKLIDVTASLDRSCLSYTKEKVY